MLCMMVCATAMFAGCNKDENNEPTPAANGGGSGGSSDSGEGIYLGIIGFNRDLYKKDISLLNNNNVQSYYNFINSMDTLNYTALYWADFSALKMMKTFPEPPKLKNVILVTFSDGLDNVSRNAAFNPEGYPSKEAYRNALQEKILNEQIHGHNVSAYTIGLKGSDVGADEEDEFMDNLRKLASSDENVFLVSNMNEALEKFSQIANELYSISTSVNLNIEIPGGYDDGQRLRITLDHASSAEASNRYIEGSFRITSDGCVLENISYHGLAAGSTSVSSSSYDGVAYGFVFVDLKQTSGEPLTANDLNKNNIMLWKKGNSGTWSTESEFDQDRSSSVSEDKNSALIMLTLDCSSSMGSDFGNMKNASNHFIATLANSNYNGGDNPTPNPGGGENPNNLPTTLYEDFNSNSWLTTWSGYDADGDGRGWGWYNETYGVNNTGCATSFSWIQDENGNNVALNTDNYLITPELYIPSDGRTLSYQVTNVNGSYPDAYSVLVLTESNGYYIISQGQIIQPLETVSTVQPEYTSRNISLNAFKGKSIKIAFRHKDYDKLAILLDNVRVQ